MNSEEMEEWRQVSDQVVMQVWGQVGDQMWGQVWRQAWDQVWMQVGVLVEEIADE